MKNLIIMFKEKLSEKNEDGFSLIELVVAIGVILVLTVGGLIGYSKITDNSRQAAVEKAASEVATAAMAYDANGKNVLEDEHNPAKKWNDSASNDSVETELDVINTDDGVCFKVIATHNKGEKAERLSCDEGLGNNGSSGSGEGENSGSENVSSCGVPNADDQSNVYQLNEIPENSTTDSHIMIVPVVNNGEYGGGSGDGRLGVRAWSCGDTELSSSNSLKVTSWSNSGTVSDLQYISGANTSKFSEMRLDTEKGYGKEIADISRGGSSNLLGAEITGNDRDRYSWLISSGRDNSNTAADPSCKSSMCRLNVDPVPTFNKAFSNSGEESAVNVEYLASHSKQASGFNPRSIHNTVLDPYNDTTTPSSLNAGQIRWVVVEWWGDDTPSDDMALELFVG